MNTFWIIFAVCGLLEYFYFKQKWNALFAIITAVSWIGLMAYILVYPPTNIIVGSWLHEVLILVFLGMAVINFYMWFRNRDKFLDENGRSAYTDKEELEQNPANRSIMNMNETEYKAYLRNRRIARRSR